MLPLRYPLRSLWVRRSRAALTVFVIALVVLALALLSGLVTSLKASLAGAGSPRNLIVLRKGASSDGVFPYTTLFRSSEERRVGKECKIGRAHV